MMSNSNIRSIQTPLRPANTVGGFSSMMPTSLFSIKSVLFVLIFVCIIILFYFLYNYLTKKTVSYKENSEHMTNGSNSSTKEAEILLFSTDWCPHCKSAKPEWEQVKTEYDGKVVNGYSILFTDVNCTNESPEVEKMMNQYKIEGYPTIKLLKDGQVVEFDAKPTKANLTQFLNTVI